METTPSSFPEIVILGAGPAGSSCALSLAKKGIPCTLIDKAIFPRDKICGDALSGKVISYLRRIEPAWLSELEDPHFFTPSHGINFFAPSGKNLRLKFYLPQSDNPVKNPGYVCTREHFDNWLVQKVKQEPLIQLIENTEIRKYQYQAKSWQIESIAGNTYRADILIACDGAYSSFAKNVGGLITEPKHNSFGLRAYYKNVAFDDPENFIELHFIKDLLPGYFWIFKMPNNTFNVGLGLLAHEVDTKKIKLKKKFEDIIHHHPTLSPRFKDAIKMEEVKLWGLPLGSKKRKWYGDHFLMCGDAAMMIDPFSGEGIGNAICSGFTAASVIEAQIPSGDFSEEALMTYQTQLEKKIGPELALSTKMQQLANYPWLFNFVVNKVTKSKVLQDTFSHMFLDINLRAQLKNPRFYWDLLFK